MLRLRKVEHLAEALRVPPARLLKVAGMMEQYVREKSIPSRSKPGRIRKVICVTGPLRQFQSNIYSRLLLPKHRPSVHSHGGVAKRNIKTNAEPHLESVFVFYADISDFYPSIHHTRIYQLFVKDFLCSPDVARILTRLCTFNHHLALGLITSPILADCILAKVDRRIHGMCLKHDLVYTRFVDDITISGKYDIRSGTTARIVGEILRCYGFKINEMKQEAKRFSEGVLITGLRIKRGRLDVGKEYIEGVRSQLDDAQRLACGETPLGDYFTRDQIFGRIGFIGWVNPGHRASLMRRFRSIDWKVVEAEAEKRGLFFATARAESVRPKGH